MKIEEQIENILLTCLPPCFIVGLATLKQGAGNVRYTPGQLRDTVGLSKEAFRHWKRVVPAFANGRGHAPTFSPGDVLASAVLRKLTDTMGVRIGHLSEIAPAIFQVCNSSSWEGLRGKHLIIDLPQRSCVAVSDPVLTDSDLIVVCTLEPLIKSLQFDLLNGQTRAHPNSVSVRPSEMRSRKRDGR